MKKLDDLPIYFIIVGLILNMIMFFYNEVSFINLMIRTSIITILFAAMGYFLAYVLRDAQVALSKPRKHKEGVAVISEKIGSAIDIRVNSEDDDDLLSYIPNLKKEEFSEISIENFNKLMDQDRH